jgi:hypothetical protein
MAKSCLFMHNSKRTGLLPLDRSSLSCLLCGWHSVLCTSCQLTGILQHKKNLTLSVTFLSHGNQTNYEAVHVLNRCHNKLKCHANQNKTKKLASRV